MKLSEVNTKQFAYYQDRCNICNSKIVARTESAVCVKSSGHLAFSTSLHLLTSKRNNMKLIISPTIIYYHIDDQRLIVLQNFGDLDLPIDIEYYFKKAENMSLLS